MYAVVESGGKQHRVREGDFIRVEKLEGEVGSSVILENVLMVGGDAPKIGKPTVDGAKVAAEVVAHGKGRKVIIFKFKRRKNYRRFRGHRQAYTDLRVTGIEVG